MVGGVLETDNHCPITSIEFLYSCNYKWRVHPLSDIGEDTESPYLLPKIQS